MPNDPWDILRINHDGRGMIERKIALDLLRCTPKAVFTDSVEEFGIYDIPPPPHDPSDPIASH